MYPLNRDGSYTQPARYNVTDACGCAQAGLGFSAWLSALVLGFSCWAFSARARCYGLVWSFMVVANQSLGSFRGASRARCSWHALLNPIHYQSAHYTMRADGYTCSILHDSIIVYDRGHGPVILALIPASAIIIWLPCSLFLALSPSCCSPPLVYPTPL